MSAGSSEGIAPLRVEFIRSALGIIDSPATGDLAADILFAFIKGTSLIPVSGAAERNVRAFLADACQRCQMSSGDMDAAARDVAAVAAAASGGQADAFVSLALRHDRASDPVSAQDDPEHLRERAG